MKKRKIKWRNIFVLLLLNIFVIVFIISSYKCITWLIDNNKTNKQISKIKDKVDIKEVKNDKDVEIIKTDETDKTNPYFDYIKMNLIDVDFNNLKKINSSTVGWIKVNGTNINYPFVQTTDNEYYLTHSFDKSYNSAGWVFLDYRNSKTLDKNNIIYAHGRLDRTMFGSLKDILTNGWLDNKDNFIVKLSRETEDTLWQVFSVYHLPTTSDYLKINFKDNKQFLEFTNMLLDRSAYNFNTTINESDKILTLSTCYNSNEKIVLHAKLIKQRIKK